MRNSIIGYPRIGELRELKFWIEDYFKGNLSFERLQNNAKELRKAQWSLLNKSRLDFKMIFLFTMESLIHRFF